VESPVTQITLLPCRHLYIHHEEAPSIICVMSPRRWALVRPSLELGCGCVSLRTLTGAHVVTAPCNRAKQTLVVPKYELGLRHLQLSVN
jgi:hypothetical protein